MFDIALEGYKRVAATLWPGKTSADSLAAGKFIHDTGYDVYGGYLQGMLGANPRHEPQIGPDRPQSAEDRYLYDEQGRLVYKTGMMFTLQMHIIDKLGDARSVSRRQLCRDTQRSQVPEQIPAAVGASWAVSFTRPHQNDIDSRIARTNVRSRSDQRIRRALLTDWSKGSRTA